MYATLTAAALTLAAAQPPATGRGGLAPPGQVPGENAAAPGAAQSIDGTWQVVALEKNGQPVPGAGAMTVTIRGGVVSFAPLGGTSADPARPAAGTGAAGTGMMRSMRLEFGPAGTIRVTEAGADNKFGTAGPSGPAPEADRTLPPGRQPDRAGLNDPPASAGAAKAGVYVLTRDYLVLSVQDRAADAAGRTSELGTGRATTDRPGTGTGGGVTAVSGLPEARSYCTVILRRTALPAAPAAAAGVSPAPGR